MPSILVIGGSSEIGSAILKHYLSLGWETHCTYHDDTSNIPDGVSKYKQWYMGSRQLDIVVTCNGLVANGKHQELHWSDWDIVVNACLSSVYKSLATCIPAIKAGGGIVVLGSVVGRTGGYGCSNYAAAKAGLVGMVKALANELVAEDKRINLLELGYVNAGMGKRLGEKLTQKITHTIPMHRFAEVEEVIKAIHFLGMEATYMTGNVLTFAGGL